MPIIHPRDNLQVSCIWLIFIPTSINPPCPSDIFCSLVPNSLKSHVAGREDHLYCMCVIARENAMTCDNGIISERTTRMTHVVNMSTNCHIWYKTVRIDLNSETWRQSVLYWPLIVDFMVKLVLKFSLIMCRLICFGQIIYSIFVTKVSHSLGTRKTQTSLLHGFHISRPSANSVVWQ